MTPQTLHQLQCAAAEWLAEHPDNPNAPQVRAALIATNKPERRLIRQEDGAPLCYVEETSPNA